MALSNIVKNIYTFANILSQAGTDAVKNWNDKSLQNALNWAAYCTQISEQTRNSSYRSDLDIQIQSFTVYLKPPSLICLTLNSLSRAREVLCKRLLQNPHCPGHILQMICDLQLKNTSICVQDRSKDSNEKYDQHLFLLLGEEQEFDQSSSTTIGSYILNRLLHLINLPPVSEHRFNRFLEQIIPVITNCDKGMESLAKLLLTDVRSINQLSETEKLKNQIVEHILQISNNQRCSSDTNNNLKTYASLQRHIRLFINYSKRMRSRLHPHLENRANKTYFNICRDLLKCL